MILNKKHIIFDWNGTLIDDAWIFVDILNALLKKRNLDQIGLMEYQEMFCFPISNFYQNVAMLLTNFLKILLFTLFVSLTQDLPIYLLFILILFLIPTRYLSKLNRKYSHISYVSANNTSEDIERVIDNLYLIYLQVL